MGRRPVAALSKQSLSGLATWRAVMLEPRARLYAVRVRVMPYSSDFEAPAAPEVGRHGHILRFQNCPNCNNINKQLGHGLGHVIFSNSLDPFVFPKCQPMRFWPGGIFLKAENTREKCHL